MYDDLEDATATSASVEKKIIPPQHIEVLGNSTGKPTGVPVLTHTRTRTRGEFYLQVCPLETRISGEGKSVQHPQDLG